jgi:transcriptional regulator with XRE-family HTH domain
MATLIEEARLAISLPDPAARMAIRRRALVSRERMADELGCHAIARWERGTRNPHGDLRLRYARLLKRLEGITAAAVTSGGGNGALAS